jgi:uncharacterized protein (TIGR02246 family)
MDQKEQILSTIHQMVDAFHKGDTAGILKAYEPGAVVLAGPGAPVTGKAGLEAMFEGFIAARARFTFLEHEVIQAGDLAVHFAPWTMTGSGPDGSPISGGGLSVAVLRRQPDGKWLMVIDDPYGDSSLKPATTSQEV